MACSKKKKKLFCLLLSILKRSSYSYFLYVPGPNVFSHGVTRIMAVADVILASAASQRTICKAKGLRCHLYCYGHTGTYAV